MHYPCWTWTSSWNYDLDPDPTLEYLYSEKFTLRIILDHFRNESLHWLHLYPILSPCFGSVDFLPVLGKILNSCLTGNQSLVVKWMEINLTDLNLEFLREDFGPGAHHCKGKVLKTILVKVTNKNACVCLVQCREMY